jgi:hypothetical protein
MIAGKRSGIRRTTMTVQFPCRIANVKVVERRTVVVGSTMFEFGRAFGAGKWYTVVRNFRNGIFFTTTDPQTFLDEYTTRYGYQRVNF